MPQGPRDTNGEWPLIWTGFHVVTTATEAFSLLATAADAHLPPDRGLHIAGVNSAGFWHFASIASQYTGRYATDRLVAMIRGLIAKTKAVAV